MSITIELPPAVAQEAMGYAMLEGTSLEGLLLSCLKSEFDRRRLKNASKSPMEKWRETVRKSSNRLREPYVFNRADAYEPERPFA